MNPEDIKGISPDVNWGAGMIRKGLNGKYKYNESCNRALRIYELIEDHPLLFDKAWQAAKVQGTAKRSVAALTMWLARGRPVIDSRDGVRGGSGPVVIFSELIKIIYDVEQIIKEDPTFEGLRENVGEGNDAKRDYIPNREDFENTIRKYNRHEIPIDTILDTMKHDLEDAGYELHKNWRSATEKNIQLWAKNT